MISFSSSFGSYLPETFEISVAYLIMGGCIVFVPIKCNCLWHKSKNVIWLVRTSLKLYIFFVHLYILRTLHISNSSRPSISCTIFDIKRPKLLYFLPSVARRSSPFIVTLCHLRSLMTIVTTLAVKAANHHLLLDGLMFRIDRNRCRIAVNTSYSVC